MTSSDRPVFVVGAPRSGTTLLYSILLSSGAFPVYETESMIMECRPRYGNLRNKDNFDRLLNDYLNSRQFHRSKLDAESFRREALVTCSSYPDFLRFFMEKLSASQQKDRWVEKTPNHIFHMKELAREFPSARFIHVVRDGRSVAASSRACGRVEHLGDNELLKLVWAARIWEIAVSHGRRTGRKLPGRYLEIRYESIIDDLDRVLVELRRFLDLAITRADVEDSQVGTLGKANSSFSDSMQGVSSKGLRRWERALSRDEVDVLDRVLRQPLRELGYQVPSDIEERGVPWEGLLWSGFSYAALRVKKLLDRFTPIGSLSQPLEIGLR